MKFCVKYFISNFQIWLENNDLKNSKCAKKPCLVVLDVKRLFKLSLLFLNLGLGGAFAVESAPRMLLD